MFRLIWLMSSSLAVSAAALDWTPLPPIPDEKGFAGSFAGVSGGALIVAGGTNFPDKTPWEGGAKFWSDAIFVLQKPDGAWRMAGRLPKANGYGVSITTDDSLILIGGGNAAEHFRDVIRLRHRDGEITIEHLPHLPKPCGFMCGALLENTICIAGGIAGPNDTEALRTFWSLDLSKLSEGWKELEPWPGSGRILAAAGAADGSFFLCSGAALKAGADGKPVREWLKDACRFTPGSGWKKTADLPRVAVAAPSPLPLMNGKLLVIGGDDGALANFEPKAKHPGFPRTILSCDVANEMWSLAGEVPFSLVTTNAVTWHGSIIIPGGEARPGVRSKEVWRSCRP